MREIQKMIHLVAKPDDFRYEGYHRILEIKYFRKPFTGEKALKMTINFGRPGFRRVERFVSLPMDWGLFVKK